jgi:carboxyl-terminal processing protease
VLNSFALEYMDKNRNILSLSYKTFEDFRKKFEFSPEDVRTFIAKGEAEGVPYDESQFEISKAEILLIMKGYIASNIWQISEFYELINQNDNVIERALEVISDPNGYKKILGYN